MMRTLGEATHGSGSPHPRRPRIPVQKGPLVSVRFSEQQGGGVKTYGVGSVS